jgi:hypothetical protein
VQAIDQAVQHVGGVELAVGQLVAHAGPGGFLAGVILMPYFLSKPITEAITTDEQSVSGMKPIFTSSISGLSEPAAHAPPAGSIVPIAAIPPRVAPALRKPRRERILSSNCSLIARP